MNDGPKVTEKEIEKMLHDHLLQLKQEQSRFHKEQEKRINSMKGVKDATLKRLHGILWFDFWDCYVGSISVILKILIILKSSLGVEF